MSVAGLYIEMDRVLRILVVVVVVVVSAVIMMMTTRKAIRAFCLKKIKEINKNQLADGGGTHGDFCV